MVSLPHQKESVYLSKKEFYEGGIEILEENLVGSDDDIK